MKQRATRRAWWHQEFENEAGTPWSPELECDVRARVEELGRAADAEQRAWLLWQQLLSVVGEIEALTATSRSSTRVSAFRQPTLKWLEFFVARFRPAELRSGLRRDEDGEIVSGPYPVPPTPKEPARVNEKESEPVSRTTLLHALCGDLDTAESLLPEPSKNASRIEIAKSVGGWTDRSVALASLLLGNRGDEPGTPEGLLATEVATIGALHRRQRRSLR
jgi:hypothetical protein